jgi:hypothetical protein
MIAEGGFGADAVAGAAAVVGAGLAGAAVAGAWAANVTYDPESVARRSAEERSRIVFN